jgi:hypothetical protein
MEDKKKIEIKETLNKGINEKAKQALRDFVNLKKTETLIKDNKAYFTFKDREYRVNTPTQEQGSVIDEAREKKLAELLQNDDYMSEEHWKKIWKKKGFDIDAIDEEIEDLGLATEALLFKLATAQKEQVIKQLSEQIEDNKEKVQDLIIKKTDKLQYSIEKRIRDFSANYTCYYMLQVKDEKGNWSRKFDSFEDYSKCQDTILVNKAMEATLTLLYQVTGDIF